MSNTALSVPGLLGGALIALAWLIPNHYLPWPSFYNDITAGLGLMVLGGHALWISRSEPLRLPIPALALAALGLLPLLQAVSGHIYFAGDGWIAAIYLAGLAFAYLVGFLLTRRSAADLAELLAWVFLCGALASAILAVLQFLRIDRLGIWVMDLRPGWRPYANLAQFNNLATLLLLGIASITYLFERFRLGLVASWTCALVLIVGLVMTQSRTPWVASIVFLVWWAWKRRAICMRSSPLAMMLALVGFGVATVAWPSLATSLHLSSVQLDERLSTGLRPIVWRQLLDAISLSPWLGFGWNQVSVAQVQVAQSYPYSVLVEHSHNVLIDLLLWNGIPVGALIIAAMAYWGLSRAIRCDTLEQWFALLVIAVVLVHGMLEFPLEYAYFLLPVGMAAGLVDAQQETKRYISLAPGIAWAIFGTAVIFLGWIWVEYREVEDAHRQMRFEQARIVSPEKRNPVPDVILLSQLREFIRFARTQARPGMSAKDLDWMRKVAHRYPYPPALFRYALALALNGKLEFAELELIRLRQLHGPTHYKEAMEGVATMARVTYPELKQLKELKLP